MIIREFITRYGIKADFQTLERLDKRVQNVRKGLDDNLPALRRLADGATQAGKRLTTRLTLPILGIGAASAKMSADFDASLSRIVGLVGLAEEEVESMRQRVLQLSGETAKSPRELADAMFFITSAGLRGAEALQALEFSAKASAAGLGDVSTVADLVTSAMNAYGESVGGASDVTDILVAAVREGKAEAPALAASLGQVLPVASQMGVTFDQVGAAVAAMTRTGTNAQTAAIQLRQVLFSLLKPSSQAEKTLEQFGLSAQGVRRMIREEGLIDVLSTLKVTFGDNEEAAAQVFGNVRALAGVLDILGANADENIAIFERMEKSTGALAAGFSAAADEDLFQFQRAFTAIRSALIALGKTISPVTTAIARGIEKMAKAFIGLSEEARIAVAIIGGIIALTGPMLIFLGLTAKLGLFAAGVKTIGSAFTLAGVKALFANASILLLPAALAVVIGALFLLGESIGSTLLGRRTLFTELVDATNEWRASVEKMPIAFRVILSPLTLIWDTVRAIGTALGFIASEATSLVTGGDTLTGQFLSDLFVAGGPVTTGGGTAAVQSRRRGSGGVSVLDNRRTTINVEVPAGTTEQQRQFVENDVRRVVREENERERRQAVSDVVEVD